jgi:hypothetical protein
MTKNDPSIARFIRQWVPDECVCRVSNIWYVGFGGISISFKRLLGAETLKFQR